MNSSVTKLGCAIVAAAVAAWFLWPRGPDRKDQRAQLDERVERVWLADERDTHDAIEFLETGGAFVDFDEERSRNIDRDVILPLLKQLKAKHGVTSVAVSSRADAAYAVGLFVKLPENRGDHKRIEADIAAADGRFAGAILTAFGNRWLSIDALTEEQAKAVLGEERK